MPPWRNAHSVLLTAGGDQAMYGPDVVKRMRARRPLAEGIGGDMRGSAGIGIACLTLALVLAGAESAAAAKSNAVLKVGGKAAPAGSPAEEVLDVGHGGETCIGEGFGQLEDNGMVKDQLSFPSFWERSGCQGNEGPGYRISRLTTTVVTIAGNGTGLVKFAPKLALTIPGPCVYEFARLRISFPLGVTVSATVTAPGKLGKKGSSPGCAPEEPFAFREALSDRETFTPYELEAAP